MKRVEFIYPYTIVEENGLYGIIDSKDNLIVPCVMDKISNDKNDDIGLDTWSDCFCVIVCKNGKYGFFTKNGKLIEPAYEAYAIDPCSGDIHVRTEEGYGVFASPDYIFEELPTQSSFLAGLDSNDND